MHFPFQHQVAISAPALHIHLNLCQVLLWQEMCKWCWNCKTNSLDLFPIANISVSNFLFPIANFPVSYFPSVAQVHSKTWRGGGNNKTSFFTLKSRGAYFPLFADIHRGIVCWISLAGVEFIWKAWIFHEKWRKKTKTKKYDFHFKEAQIWWVLYLIRG